MLTIVVSLCLTQLNWTYNESWHEGLRSPARIAVAPDSSVLVTDTFYDQVVRFDANGNKLSAWPVPDGPIGIAVHPDGRYFVSLRERNAVAIYDSSFTLLGYLGVGQVTFVRPTDLAVAVNTGKIYVVDSGADKVYGFDAAGSLTLTLGTRGGGNGEFRYPSAVTIDEARDRLIVADHDNFRVQVFTTDGTFVLKFGDRNKYPAGAPAEGWTPRTQGLAVDAQGRIYVADAMMSHVRMFDSGGVELAKVLQFGTGPGQLRTPADLAFSLDGSVAYVVNTNAAAVEVYQTTDRGPGGGPGLPGPDHIKWPVGPVGDESPGGGNPRTVYEGPHFIESPIICGRCHGIRSQPGGHEGLPDGQAYLCMSCHTAAGQGLNLPVHTLDLANPYGTNPGAIAGHGRSHAWGVPAVSSQADSVGPAANGEMARYLTNGVMKCATCHSGHNDTAGAPYLRVSNRGDAMCKECHAPRNKGLGERGTHPVGFAYPGGTGEFPQAGDLASVFIKEGKVECLTCHAPHDASSGGANNGEGDGMLLRAANNETLCQSCHTDHNKHAVGGSWEPSCRACHDPHDPASNNLSLVARTVHNDLTGEDVPVVFTDASVGVGPGAFVSSDPSVKGICEACHAYPSDNPNLLPRHTLDGTMPVCTQCHNHSQGFKPGLILPPGQFAGATTCGVCHTDTHNTWDQTLHASAFNALPSYGQTNPNCLPCHTVGFGQPDGYVDQSTTPGLSGVQCENCHGAARNHAADPHGTVPTIDKSAALCGSCHTGVHHPTYDEWQQSGQVGNGHAHSSADAHSTSCYECHAPLGQQGSPAALLNVECVACHDSHTRTGNAAAPPEGRDYQLLKPEVVATVPSNVLADCQNPARFNLCGSCHHTRGNVTWQSTSRGPHHSVQGNVYVGEMPVPDGVDLVPPMQSDHFGLQLQCNTCHMYKADYQAGPPEVAAKTGHSWQINYEACAGCHGSAEAAQALAEGLQGAVQARLDAITAALGDPSTWEYSCCGGPSNQSGISNEVKKARYMKKYIENDGSKGVHNAGYVNSMLTATEGLLGIPPPGPRYMGAGVCNACHGDTHATWDQTLHASAFNALPSYGQTNPACLPCHTVGFGQPSGYVDQGTTPGLAGVQCENCHGAAGNHVLAPNDVTQRPTIDKSAALCGSCHTGVHHPTYDEWQQSGQVGNGHAHSSADAHSTSCYECHAPLGQQGSPAALLNVECVACHDSHTRTGNAAAPPEGRDYQLLKPEVVATVPSNVLADCQNPARFNLCGSCHHTRGNVTWQSTSRGPHHSVQGNVYVGEMPVPDGVNLVPFATSYHFGLQLQCNTCHMYKADYQAGPPEVAAKTGHSWQIDYEACADCHGSADVAHTLTQAFQATVQTRLDAITAALGDPSTWEYSCCGGPSNQSGISNEVKKARYMKKYIENDGSLGVHNAVYVYSMLDLTESLLGLPIPILEPKPPPPPVPLEKPLGPRPRPRP